MRITHVIGSIDPSQGGPPAVAVRLASAQALAGHEVSIASKEGDQNAAAVHEAFGAVPGFDQVRRVGVPHASGPFGVLRELMGFSTSSVAVDGDMIHMHGIWELLLVRMASAAFRQHIPYCITPHGMLDPWSLSQKRIKKQIALALTHRRMLRHAAFLHLLNADEAALLQPLGLKAATEVIPNGVSIEEIEPLPPRGSFRKRYPLIGEAPYVLFLGRLHFKKGLDYLADMFVRLSTMTPDAHLVVAGPDDGAKGAFENAIAAAHLEGRVHVVGPLYGRVKWEAMVDATCFCLLSRQEGFSVAIAEAMACRLPVVISESCHFPEVAEVGAGFITPLDAEVIAQRVFEVLSNPSLRDRMGNAGRRLIEERYTWSQVAKQTLAVYQRYLRR